MEKLLNDFKISFVKGDTYALAVKFKNIKDDLGSAYFTVKENADDAPLVQKTLGAGISKIDDRAYKNEKTYKIQLQSEDTANLEPLVQYLYDFRVAVGNVVQTILSGVFVIQHSISNVSTTSTETLTVEIADTLESEVSTTDPTKGIEYEQDPVACGKIGDLSTLATTNKDTLTKAVNEVNGKLSNEIQTRAREMSAESKARTDADTALYNRLKGIEDGTTTIPNATNAEKAQTADEAKTANTASYSNVAYGLVSEDITLELGTAESVSGAVLLPVKSASQTLYDGQVIYYDGETAVIHKGLLTTEIVCLTSSKIYAQSGNSITVQNVRKYDELLPFAYDWKEVTAGNTFTVEKGGTYQVVIDANSVGAVGDIVQGIITIYEYSAKTATYNIGAEIGISTIAEPYQTYAQTYFADVNSSYALSCSVMICNITNQEITNNNCAFKIRRLS